MLFMNSSWYLMSDQCTISKQTKSLTYAYLNKCLCSLPKIKFTVQEIVVSAGMREIPPIPAGMKGLDLVYAGRGF